MAEKLETSPALESRGSPTTSRDVELDRDRTASMADEGGVTAALVDLREQLAELDDTLEEQNKHAWARSLLWGSLAIGAGAVLFGLLRARRV